MTSTSLAYERTCSLQGYRDEPLVKIIHHVEEGPVVLMDRWALDIRRNDELPSFHYEDTPGTEDVSVCMHAYCT